MSKAAQVKAPWLNSRDPEVPATLTYSELSMCSRVEEMVRRYPDYIAYEFMGKCTTYAEMWKKINACAKSLKAIGIREGDKVTICMPNAPQTLCMFYAVNMVGAIAKHGPPPVGGERDRLLSAGFRLCGRHHPGPVLSQV